MFRSMLTSGARMLLCVALAAGAITPTLTARSQELTPFPTVSPDRILRLIQAAEQQLDYVPGEVLVKFRGGVSAEGQQRALQSAGTRPRPDGVRWIGDIALVRDEPTRDAKALAALYAAQPEVELAEPNYIGRPQDVPNDPSFGPRQWNLQQLKMPTTWDIAPGADPNVVVAVIDSGVTAVSAQNFSARTWDGEQIVNIIVPVAPSPDLALTRFRDAADFTVNQTFPSTLVIDTDGHGTHTASTIGQGTNNGISLAGIAYNATLMPLKSCMSAWDLQFSRSAAGIPGFAPITTICELAPLVAAIRYAADHGAQVINISLGGFGNSNFLFSALQYAHDRGVFIAISNGNSFASGNVASYPAAFAPQFDGVMSVAAATRRNGHAWYSTTNAQTEIAAYGGDTNATFDDGIWQLTLNFDDSDPEVVIFPRFDRYQEIPQQGTSMASPHVAGLAALLHSRGIRSAEAKEAHIIATALDIGSKGEDDQFGHGLIQPRAALFGLGIRK